MRIVIVSDYAHINGGAAKVALSSAVALADAGHDIHVFSAVAPIEQTLLNHQRIKVTCLEIPKFNSLSGKAALKAGTWNPEAAEAFGEALAACNPHETIVHAHQIRDALTPAVVRKAIDLRFPTIFTSHDYSLGCPYGGFLDVPTSTICTRKGMSLSCITAKCNDSGRIKKAAILYKHAIQQGRGKMPKGLDAVLFVSEFSKRVLSPYVEGVGLKAVIPNPIDVIKSEPAEIKSENPYLYIGVLNSGKDPITAAKAAKLAGIKIAFIGDGPLLDTLRTDHPEAEVLGWLSADEVQNKLRHSRGLIFPSLLLETQGMAAYEALANGIPIICSDVTAASEATKVSGGGVLFKAGDAEDLAQKLRDYEDIDRAKQDGRSGYDWFWADPPTMDKHLQRLIEVYESVLATKRTSS
ncbi:MAG: glycosyltransferase family 4 protein [Fimbriimonadaceae bacterium]|nr:glycosyltransferase family 4 protein [Fimbriimonadaceae bacterium]